jgi:GNAT superfamily N-acetyltransferase
VHRGPIADSVRLALPAEATAIAQVQRRAWAQLDPEIVERLMSEVDEEEASNAWERAIVRPPAARYRVLVAVSQGAVVGFATTMPSTDPDAEPGVDGMIDEFAVDPVAQGRGHGSRLLNACVDTLKADGFRRATWWVVTGDDGLRAFLTKAGWAPDGSWREVGSDDGSLRLKLERLHSDIGEDGLNGR